MRTLEQHLAAKLTAAGPRLAAGPFGSRLAISHRNNIITLGDACENLDPIGGLGMTHALLSAQLAAQALIEILSCHADPEAALRCYQAARLKKARRLRLATQLAHLAVRHCGNPLLFQLLNNNKLLAAWHARLHS